MNSHQWSYVQADQLTQPIVVDGQELAGFVFLVRFSIIVTDALIPPNSLDYRNQFQFPQPTTPTGYTPASQVTEAMIMQWLSEALMPDGVTTVPDYYNALADAALANKVNPPVITFVPASP